MGSLHSLSTPPSPQSFSIFHFGYCKVWLQKQSDFETLQEYSIRLDSKTELQQYKKMIRLRSKDSRLIQIKYFTHHTVPQLCHSYEQCSLIIQRTPFRLSQFAYIPKAFSLSILESTITPFQNLYHSYGLFLIRSTMIGLIPQSYNTLERENAGGKVDVKVWHHTDLSAAHPENSNCKSIRAMLMSLVQSVELNADHSFKQFTHNANPSIYMSFTNLRKELNQYICYKQVQEINIMDLTPYLRKIDSVDELIKKRIISAAKTQGYRPTFTYSMRDKSVVKGLNQGTERNKSIRSKESYMKNKEQISKTQIQHSKKISLKNSSSKSSLSSQSIQTDKPHGQEGNSVYLSFQAKSNQSLVFKPRQNRYQCLSIVSKQKKNQEVGLSKGKIALRHLLSPNKNLSTHSNILFRNDQKRSNNKVLILSPRNNTVTLNKVNPQPSFEYRNSFTFKSGIERPSLFQRVPNYSRQNDYLQCAQNKTERSTKGSLYLTQKTGSFQQ